MRPPRWRRILLLTVVLTGGAAQAQIVTEPATDEPVLFEESFRNNNRGWQTDEYSRVDGGGYVIDARSRGGFPRWLNDPANLRDFRLRVEVQPLQPGLAAHFGLLFRLQDSWANSYYFLVNGAGRYAFGKFVAGKDVVLKEGAAAKPPAVGSALPLEVVASGTTFRLTVGDEPVATVVDATFPAGGRVGVYAEAPSRVKFDNLRVTQPRTAADTVAPAVRFVDHFNAPNGWPEDQFRKVADGAYHLVNNGEARSFLAWNRATEATRDFVARIDAKQVSGSGHALFGLVFRVQDAQHYGFFVIGPDGRFYAGVSTGEELPEVRRHGRHLAIRTGGETNSLEVRGAGGHFTCSVNGAEAASFDDDTLRVGAIGVYLQDPADVAFDDLTVTDLPDDAPPPVGDPGRPKPLAVGQALFLDRLLEQGAGGWTVDAFHGFEEGGYVVRGPESGSRTVVRPAAEEQADGVFTVVARAVVGPVQSGFGLTFRTSADGANFYFLLISGTGKYFMGKCQQGKYTVLDAGPVALLRGGDSGNELQVTAAGPVLRYSINDRALGIVQDDSLATGRLGLHVENGVTACFRDLRAFTLPARH